MRRFPFFIVVLAALAGAPALTGCDFFLGETKTSQGQLYQSGDSRYDPYFEAVHKEQLESANWTDEAKDSRKPIVSALNLKPDASNGTVLTATHELKSGSAGLGVPVEQTTTAETDRAKRMHALVQHLEEMRDQGKALRDQAGDDKANMGAARADDKAVAKKDEVKRELGGAVDVLGRLINDARKASHEAEELADKLTEAWTGRPEDEKHINVDDKAFAKKAEPATSASASVSAAPAAPPPKKTASKPKPAAPAPAPAPAPAAKPPDEVFNP